MPLAVDDVARSALAAVGSNAGLLLAIRWASDRYRQLSNRGKLRALRKVDQIVMPAAIEAGLATVTRDSELVTGDATAQAAWNSDQVGWYFRASRNWYRVAGVESDGAGGVRLRLHTQYTEADATKSYKLVQRHIRLPGDVHMLGRFVHQRLWRPLSHVSLNELDLMHPERLFVTGSGPEMWAEVGDDEDGTRLIEFYPYSTQSDTVLFYYFARSPELKPGDPLPDDLTTEALKAGILVDIYRFEMAKALRDNKIEAAAVWRNECRAQETTWEDRMQELHRIDRSADDISVILHTMGPPHYGDHTWIRTARADAWSRLENWP